MVNPFDNLYPFVYRALLTEESLDKAGRKTRAALAIADAELLEAKLSYDMLDSENLEIARRMSIAYSAIHCFENMVRSLVKTTLLEVHKELWWEQVPERIRKRVASRMEEDTKFKWHGTRGSSEIEYCDFGDLSSIIVVNWQSFELSLSDLEWAKSVLGVLERSRNIVMHGGSLSIQDLERVGGNIRDWVRQVG